MLIKLFLLIFIIETISVLPQNELAKVRSLNVDSLKSEITVYYTPGYKKRAEYLAEILTTANHFFRDSLGVEYEYHLAVLDETQWDELHCPYPYGLPWNNAFRPYVIFMPADTSHGAVVDDLSNFLEHGAMQISMSITSAFMKPDTLTFANIFTAAHSAIPKFHSGGSMS